MSFTAAPILRTFGLVAACLVLVAASLSPAVSHAASGVRQTPPVLPSCSWNRPGVDPFMGDVVAAVDRYADIPADVRSRLKQRMAKREYDDLVSIRRDRIVGERGEQYNPAIRDMHFGAGQVCRTVSRDAWTPAMQERGLVYCESGHCILVPTICRNVSRIARRGVAPEHAEAPDEPFLVLPPAGAPPAVAGAPVFGEAGPAPAGLLATDGSPSFAGPATGGAGGGVPRAFASAAAGAPVVAGAPDAGPPAEVPPTGSFPSADSPLPITIAAAIPEPATWLSMIAGLIGVALMRRRWIERR